MRTRWSQNFLVNPGAAEAIVRAMDLVREDPVLEIGPGRGVLTDRIVQGTDKFTAVEIDPVFAQGLNKKWADKKGFKVIARDFLDADLDQIFISGERTVKVVGNLPYAVASPIIQKVLAWKGWKLGVFMVQKEVGDRIRAVPGSKDYGVLSVSVQSRCKVRKILDVSRNSFRPTPNVDSVVLAFEPMIEAAYGPHEEMNFYKTVKAAFAQRRKMAANSLASGLGIKVQDARQAIVSLGLPAGARAETISISNFVRLVRILYHT